MTKTASLVLGAVLLTACQPDQQAVDRSINHGILKFTTAGGVECIHHSSGNKAGISCNWVKYNKLIQECRREHERQSVFPDVDGRCEGVVARGAN